MREKQDMCPKHMQDMRQVSGVTMVRHKWSVCVRACLGARTRVYKGGNGWPDMQDMCPQLIRERK
jgi:hypothetical protein